MTPLLAAESVGDISSELNALFEFRPFLFEGSGLLALNRVGLLYLLSAVIVGVMLFAAFGSPKLVPGKFQLAMEQLAGFVRNNIAIDVIGPQGARYTPLLLSLFLFIWVNNFYEIMPGVQFPTTSRMAVPAMLAILTWTVFILAGLSARGPKYFLEALMPSGVPKVLYVVIIPIELVSTFVVRPLTLAIRLFANMMAGHIILAIVFISASTFLVDVHDLASPEFFPNGILGGILGIFLAFVAGPLLVVFELVVGLIQAYIFTILTAVYINSSLSHH